MTVTEEVSLNLSGNNELARVYVKQLDRETRNIRCHFHHNGIPCAIPAGIIARAGMTKPDGKTVLNDQTVNNGDVIVELTPQMLITAGEAPCEVQLYQGKTMISSAVFTVVIMPSAVNRKAVESSPEYESFVEVLGLVGDALEDAQEAVQNANAATANANTAITGANNAANAANTAAAGANKARDDANKAAADALKATDDTKKATADTMKAKDDAIAAAELASHVPRISDDEYWTMWDKDTKEYVKTEHPARGPKGDRGDVQFALFQMNALSGRLLLHYGGEYNGPGFRLNGRQRLEVIYHA